MSDVVQIEYIHAVAIGLPAIIAAIFSYLGLKQGQRNHKQMNSLLDIRLHDARVAARAEGVLEEKKRNNA